MIVTFHVQVSNLREKPIHILFYGIVISTIVGCGLIFSSFIGPVQPLMIEDCINGVDDDGDGLVDLNDPDCTCELLSPVSLIPNPSFEESTCCPTERSMLNCAVGWVQASEPTTDLIHPCGWVGWNDHRPPTPFPDGEAIIGFANGRINAGVDPEYNWKEYAGACLLSPLRANTTYRFQFDIGFTNELLSPRLDVTFYGTTDCDNLPFGVGDPDFGCPTNGPDWQILGVRNVGGRGGAEWVNTEITITPDEDIHAIAIGPPCERSGANNTTYYFFDNLILADLRSFQFQISEVNHPCADDFTLSVPDERDVTYQWFKDNIALVGEDAAELSMIYGEGEYQVRIINEGSCLLTESFTYKIPVIENVLNVTLCHDGFFELGETIITEPGNYTDTLKNANNCDSIVGLTVEVLPELMDSVVGKIFRGETFEGVEDFSFNSAGTFDLNLMTDLGCDSLVHLQLEYYDVYFPNIFAPNSDGPNNRFVISGNEDLSEIKTLDIYDRWGQQVYSGVNELSSDYNGWDGTFRGTLMEQGVYTYISTLEMDDGNIRQFVGSLMLMK